MNYCRLRPDVDRESDSLHRLVRDDVAVFAMDEERVNVFYRSKHYYVDFEEFDRNWVIADDGAEVKAAAMAATLQKMQDVDVEFDELTQSLAAVNPQALLSNETAAAPASRTDMVMAAKLHVGQARMSAMQMKEKIDLQVKAAKALIAEQVAALEVRQAELKGMMAKAEECIWTLNLYVGTDESITTIREGQPAPQNERISIRQLILFMDEESTALAEEGGIDVRSVAEFDEWVKIDKNLQIILPEQKGIAALHIRRHKMKYTDPWDEELNESNTRNTYLLIRNGEKLWRVQFDMLLGYHLFPTTAEFDELFIDKRTGERIRPDNPRYNLMMDEADNKTRHYMRVLLVLQGLIDRTDFFQPYPDQRVRLNVCDKSDYDNYLRFVYDAENLLTTSHPEWHDWLKAANAKLDVGCRIAGSFNASGVYRELHGDRDYGGRITPRTANGPDSLTLYTIEDVENKDDFIIRYERTDTIWDRYGRSKKPEVRARCIINKDDWFIINFDAITLEECEYYINSRRHRHNYVKMIPLLQYCATLKREELAEEAPFKELLIGEVHKEHGLGREECVTLVDDTVSWWKYKNRTHRALKESDALAYSMILSEVRVKLRRTSERDGMLTPDTVRQIVKAVSNDGERQPLLVAHKAGNKFIALFPMTGNNVWVREELWTLNRTTREVYQNDAKDWKFVDGRHLKWNIVYHSDRWKSGDEIVWVINPRRKDYLTRDDAERLVVTAMKSLEDNCISRHRWHDDGESNRFLPLAIRIRDDKTVEIVHSDEIKHIPEYPISTIGKPSISVASYRYENNKPSNNFHRGLNLDRHELDDLVKATDGVQILQVFPENIEIIRSELSDVIVANLKFSRHDRAARELSKSYGDYHDEYMVQKERAAYIAKYGSDIGFKPSEKHDYNDWALRTLVLMHFVRGIPIIGLTIEELLANVSEWDENFEFDDRIDCTWTFPTAGLLTSDSSS